MDANSCRDRPNLSLSHHPMHEQTHGSLTLQGESWEIKDILGTVYASPSQSPRGGRHDLGVSQSGGNPTRPHSHLLANIKGHQSGPASEHPQPDTMKIPILPAVALLSLLALHAAQGAALGGAEVSTPPTLAFQIYYPAAPWSFLSIGGEGVRIC